MGTSKLTEEQIRKATLAAIKACKIAGAKDEREDRQHADNIETFGVHPDALNPPDKTEAKAKSWTTDEVMGKFDSLMDAIRPEPKKRTPFKEYLA